MAATLQAEIVRRDGRSLDLLLPVRHSYPGFLGVIGGGPAGRIVRYTSACVWTAPSSMSTGSDEQGASAPVAEPLVSPDESGAE
ncbi:MAG: hypothetical protein A2Z17_06780 [Gammaproteobacteria bacterium RBG_16_66_13]|nr:MAG: hypothetical protein A2Z17_06780 [Gammaproteobacteria bacterium RBG_16_66_13]